MEGSSNELLDKITTKLANHSFVIQDDAEAFVVFELAEMHHKESFERESLWRNLSIYLHAKAGLNRVGPRIRFEPHIRRAKHVCDDGGDLVVDHPRPTTASRPSAGRALDVLLVRQMNDIRTQTGNVVSVFPYVAGIILVTMALVCLTT